jgi:hypothetical protein
MGCGMEELRRSFTKRWMLGVMVYNDWVFGLDSGKLKSLHAPYLLTCDGLCTTSLLNLLLSR